MRTAAIPSASVDRWRSFFWLIMDNTEEGATFQFFTVKNEEENSLVDMQDVLSLSNAPEDKQIFYLTFNGDSNEIDGSNDDSLFQLDNISNSIDEALPLSDVKLITLEDGSMFVTTDENLGCFQSTQPQVIVDEMTSDDTDQNLVNDFHIEQNSNDKLLGAPGVDYQLVELADGTQAVLTIYKVNESTDEELPVKKKKFKCTYEGCEKLYGSYYHLTVHMRSHTDCRPYECTEEGCDKRFSTNYSLKAHIRTHTGETPYPCSVCTKQFKTSGDLQKHIRIHTGEKPFECPIEGCGKSFTTSNIRKVHIRSHTGERPYNCTYPDCGKAFTSATNFKNHLRIHSGEKPYLCPVEGCGKRFTEYSSLYKHNTVHKPVRPHACAFCGQRFKQESALNFHKKLKHNIVITKDGTEILVKIE